MRELARLQIQVEILQQQIDDLIQQPGEPALRAGCLSSAKEGGVKNAASNRRKNALGQVLVAGRHDCDNARGVTGAWKQCAVHRSMSW